MSGLSIEKVLELRSQVRFGGFEERQLLEGAEELRVGCAENGWVLLGYQGRKLEELGDLAHPVGGLDDALVHVGFRGEFFLDIA